MDNASVSQGSMPREVGWEGYRGYLSPQKEAVRSSSLQSCETMYFCGFSTPSTVCFRANQMPEATNEPGIPTR